MNAKCSVHALFSHSSKGALSNKSTKKCETTLLLWIFLILNFAFLKVFCTSKKHENYKTGIVCNRPKFYFQNRFSFLAKNVFKFGHLVNEKKMVFGNWIKETSITIKRTLKKIWNNVKLKLAKFSNWLQIVIINVTQLSKIAFFLCLVLGGQRQTDFF